MTTTTIASMTRDTKRKWHELDWEVVMEAQTFVAVYAAMDAPAPAPLQQQEEEEDDGHANNKGKTKPPTRAKAKGRNRQATTAKPAVAATPSRRSKRSRTAATKVVTRAQEEKEEDDADEPKEPVNYKANGSDAEPEEFWIAELQDDITEDMLNRDSDATVRVTWLNKRPGVGGGSDPATCRYVYAYDEVIEVQTILCHVFMNEYDDDSFQLTAKSLERVRRCLRRTKGELTNAEDDEDVDMSDHEKPPSSKRRRKSALPKENGEDEGGRRARGSGGVRRTSKGPRKLSKREEAMHIPPRFTSVDETKYTDTEIFGTHGFELIKDDVQSMSKEVIRAVATKNHKLLKKLTEDKSVYKEVCSFSVRQSADVKRTALDHAVDMDDLVAAAMLFKAFKIEQDKLAKKPECSLPSHSTGQHTSSYSDYNRRAINASRGGREGNNALTEDLNHFIESESMNALWHSNNTSVQMLTLAYPTGDWSGGACAERVARLCRVGNYQLARKLVGALNSNSGWGFNDLHVKVLSDTDEELPVFRAVSAIKQAFNTKIRPLHLAAINPNVKYLKALWESVGDQWSTVKDAGGYEAIHYAAACESTRPLEFLLERKCNMFARTKRRQTPIMRAITNRREDNAILIMDKAAEDSDEMRNKVISERGPGSFQPIHYAAYRGCAKVLKYLAEHNADVNSVCENKLTPLCLAAREGYYDSVKVLLEHGAKVNLGDKLKKTPLIHAVKNGHTRVAALLINHGANVNAFDTSENSVVHYAASYGWLSCLELLVDAGAELWAKNSWGFVPLACALLKQHMKCTEAIMEKDMNHELVNFRDRQGCTVLFLQCKMSKNLSQIKYLLEKGVDPKIANIDNECPLQVILQRACADKRAKQFYIEVARLLLKHGAKAHYEEEYVKQTGAQQPLQMTIQGDLRELFTLLLEEYDADPNRCSSDGTDAWMASVTRGEHGDFYLETLLAHHAKKYKGRKLVLKGCDTDGDNFFHCISGCESYHYADPHLIRKYLEQCENTDELMKALNRNRVTPLLRLVWYHRGHEHRDLALPEHADTLKQYQNSDKRYIELVKLLVEFSHGKDSWFRCLDENTMAIKKTRDAARAEASPSEDLSSGTTTDAGEMVGWSTPFRPRHWFMASRFPRTSADGDVDMEMAVFDDKKKTDPPPKWIEISSILHFATNHALQASSESISSRWFGENLVEVLLRGVKPDKETLNYPQYNDFKTPLDYAVENSNTENVKVLLASGADPNHSPVKCEDCTKNQKSCSRSCPREPLETSLVVAVRNDHFCISTLLLEHGADVNCYEQDTLNYPLHLAMAKNNAQITSALLEHGGDLTMLNADGSSPLLLAMSRGHSVVPKEPHEGEVNYTESKGTSSTSFDASAISVALKSKQARHAVDLADKKKRTPVHFAARNRDVGLLRALLAASVNKKESVNAQDEFGRTPLHYAVNASAMNPNASFEVERFLLQCGASPNLQDAFGFTALHFALFKVPLDWHDNYGKSKNENEAKKEREEGTYQQKKEQAFLDMLTSIPAGRTDPVETVSNLTSIPGINTTAQDVLGRTPLHLAAATGAFVCASAIVGVHKTNEEKKRAISIVDNSNFTPLGAAVRYLRQTTIMTLLQNGAAIDGVVTLKEGKSVKQYSYFYHAVKHSLSGICHMLLGAKFSKRQAVEDAILCGQFQLAKNLMVSIEVSGELRLLITPNDDEETLLHSMAKVEKPFDSLARTIAWELVDAGISVAHTDKHGNSALHYAAKLGNIHLMDFLLHNKCDLNLQNQRGETPLVFALKYSSCGFKTMMKVLKNLVHRPSFKLHVNDKANGNGLSALIDRYINDSSNANGALFTWVEWLLKKGVDPNVVFMSNAPEDMFKNKLFGNSKHVQMPLLVRVLYAPSSAVRFSALGLLLRYGAKVYGSDSNGNSVLMHLVALNRLSELKLVLGKSEKVRESSDVRRAIAHTNKLGQSVLHIAVKPLRYVSYENTAIMELLLSCGANVQVKDKQNQTPVDYALDQSSRRLYRVLRKKCPRSDEEVFDEEMEEWKDAPDYATDAERYIEECEANGKITRTIIQRQVNWNCDVGRQSHVFGQLDKDGKVVSGEEYDALLTKVDVKNGRFGLNVFYRCQVVHDQIQDLYVVFTNWGRIGETGKFQNTPFHSADDAVTEFKKIFRSKTGNPWDERHNFVKHNKRYNLVQRVNYRTILKDEVTSPFVEVVKSNPSSFAKSKRCFDVHETEMLYAITDVRNLQLAATQDCNYTSDIPLANSDEMRGAVNKLVEIRAVIESRNKVDEELQKVRGDLSDQAAAKLSDLSQQHSEMTEEISEKSSRYYEVMPCNEDAFGSSIKGFDSVEDVNKEISRLRMLLDIMDTYKMLLGAKRQQKVVHPLDYCYDAMQVHVTSLSSVSQEAELLKEYFFRGIRPSERARYRVSHIFTVSRNGEKERFMKTLRDTPSLQDKHARLLWHGTRRTNLMGILSQGLRIAPPEAPHSGYMYGKGLYFANVSAKSLEYCDSPYVISTTTTNAEGEEVKKDRKVHYLLLNEVALGKSVNVTSAHVSFSQSPLARMLVNNSFAGKVDSVYASGQHTPDPEGTVVSPLCGAALPIGKVGRVGHDSPVVSEWAFSECRSAQRYYDAPNTSETTGYLDALAEELEVGQTREVNEEDKKLFYPYWSSENKTISVECVEKTPLDPNETGLFCSAALTIHVSQPDNVRITYQAKRYHNVFYNSDIGKEFKLAKSQRCEYDEMIVYNEGQARIRYLVEVESLSSEGWRW